MNKLLLLCITVLTISCSQQLPDHFVPVKVNTTMPDFYISKYEVTQQEWRAVMGYNPSFFKGDHLPVETVSWYDCIEYCNNRSDKEGLQPYYTIDTNNKDLHNTNEMDTI